MGRNPSLSSDQSRQTLSVPDLSSTSPQGSLSSIKVGGEISVSLRYRSKVCGCYAVRVPASPTSAEEIQTSKLVLH